MQKPKSKGFLFTNENLYDQNIFGRVYPQFIEALQTNNLINLHKAVESYYYLTQHFYEGLGSNDLELQLASVKDMLNSIAHVKTKSEALRRHKVETAAAVELRQIWKAISNHLHQIEYFKKQTR